MLWGRRVRQVTYTSRNMGFNSNESRAFALQAKKQYLPTELHRYKILPAKLHQKAP